LQEQQQYHQTSTSAADTVCDHHHEESGIYRKIICFIVNGFIALWPYCSAVYEGTFFVYMLLYLFKDINYHTPLLHLQKLTLKRVTVIDLLKDRRDMMISRLKQLSYFQQRGGLWNIVTYLLRLGYSISDYSTYFLLFMAFIFKFFEWWYASENQFKSKSTVNIPPPPVAPARAAGGIELPSDTSLCPLCKKKRKNPTLLSISGYVFCYTCIHQQITKNACCPITLVAPATINHLRRLYEQ
jgi:peroxin-12